MRITTLAVFVVSILFGLNDEAQGLRFPCSLSVRRKVSRQINLTVLEKNSILRQRPYLKAYESAYLDVNSPNPDGVVSSVVSKAMEILFNPVALVFVIYFFAVGYAQLGNLAKATFKLIRRDGGELHSESAVDTPFQVFECEKCHMQMRPAKGRAQKILTREKFRCARCGARASSYFDIDNMDDPRAIARVDRLERKTLEEDYEDNSD